MEILTLKTSPDRDRHHTLSPKELLCQLRIWLLPTQMWLMRGFSMKLASHPGQSTRYYTHRYDWNRTKGTFLHHDNASSHTSKMTRQFIDESGLQILPHPPYSPNLAPCYLWLFLRIQKYLKGRIFSSHSEVEGALRNVIGDIVENELKLAIQAWFKRMNKCIQAKGCYFGQL